MSNLQEARPVPPAGPPLLLADAMLGRLARWLRWMGYDTAYARGWTDHQIAARARAESRIVLTRDRELARRKGIHCLLIGAQDLDGQLEEVLSGLGLPADELPPRCTLCNVRLEDMARHAAEGRVPPYVLRAHERFRCCPTCDRVYWQGSHWDRVRETVKRLQGERHGRTTSS